MKLTENDWGNTRLVHKFIWLPTKLYSDRRWLSREYVVQKVERYDVGGSMEWGRYAYSWQNRYWLNAPTACLDLYVEWLKEA